MVLSVSLGVTVGVLLIVTVARSRSEQLHSKLHSKLHAQGTRAAPSRVEPSYHYKYSVTDRKTGDVKGAWEKRAGDLVWGAYFLRDPDGHWRTVHYEADNTGFYAEVKRRRLGRRLRSKAPALSSWKEALQAVEESSREDAHPSFSNLGSRKPSGAAHSTRTEATHTREEVSSDENEHPGDFAPLSTWKGAVQAEEVKHENPTSVSELSAPHSSWRGLIQQAGEESSGEDDHPSVSKLSAPHSTAKEGILAVRVEGFSEDEQPSASKLKNAPHSAWKEAIRQAVEESSSEDEHPSLRKLKEGIPAVGKDSSEDAQAPTMSSSGSSPEQHAQHAPQVREQQSEEQQRIEDGLLLGPAWAEVEKHSQLFDSANWAAIGAGATSAEEVQRNENKKGGQIAQAANSEEATATGTHSFQPNGIESASRLASHALPSTRPSHSYGKLHESTNTPESSITASQKQHRPKTEKQAFHGGDGHKWRIGSVTPKPPPKRPVVGFSNYSGLSSSSGGSGSHQNSHIRSTLIRKKPSDPFEKIPFRKYIFLSKAPPPSSFFKSKYNAYVGDEPRYRSALKEQGTPDQSVEAHSKRDTARATRGSPSAARSESSDDIMEAEDADWTDSLDQEEHGDFQERARGSTRGEEENKGPVLFRPEPVVQPKAVVTLRIPQASYSGWVPVVGSFKVASLPPAPPTRAPGVTSQLATPRWRFS